MRDRHFVDNNVCLQDLECLVFIFELSKELNKGCLIIFSCFAGGINSIEFAIELCEGALRMVIVPCKEII